MEMTSNDNKHIITNEIVQIRQYFLLHVTFLLSSEFLSHANNSLPKRHFLHKHFLCLNVHQFYLPYYIHNRAC